VHLLALALASATLGGCREAPSAAPPSPDQVSAAANQAQAELVDAPTPPPDRLAPLAEGELDPRFLAKPACRLTRDGQILVAATPKEAVARVDGRLRVLAKSGAVDPSGAFFRAPGVTISIGRISAVAPVAEVPGVARRAESASAASKRSRSSACRPTGRVSGERPQRLPPVRSHCGFSTVCYKITYRNRRAAMRRRPFRPAFATPAETPIADINTTPLIDVMLVLLIMFILTVPLATHAVKIDIPPPDPRVLEEPETHRLAIAGDGSLSFDGAPIALSALPARLAFFRSAQPDGLLQLSSEAETRYEAFDKVLATVKGARITRLAFVGNERFEKEIER
jgi:biopolymer transport protein ExbD